MNSSYEWKQNNSTRLSRKSPFETSRKQWEINLNNPRDKSPSPVSIFMLVFIHLVKFRVHQACMTFHILSGRTRSRKCAWAFSQPSPQTLLLNARKRRFLCEINFSVRIETLSISQKFSQHTHYVQHKLFTFILTWLETQTRGRQQQRYRHDLNLNLEDICWTLPQCSMFMLFTPSWGNFNKICPRWSEFSSVSLSFRKVHLQLTDTL